MALRLRLPRLHLACRNPAKSLEFPPFSPLRQITSMDIESARFNMIEQQVRPWEVLDPRVLETLGAIRREDFAPPRYRKLAFSDMSLPLEHGQVMMKPVVEGRMLQALDIQPDSDVLEIGTGSGFITACLAELGREVLSIDIFDDMVERAGERIRQLGLNNVRLQVADVMGDFDPGRRFDAVAVTGAVAAIPQRFLDWVRPGGRLFVIDGASPAMQAWRLILGGDGHWQRESLFETDLPYLIHAEPEARFVF
jgi:protein-L-isoaspartate(D-aspartate) O-methyltransferase